MHGNTLLISLWVCFVAIIAAFFFWSFRKMMPSPLPESEGNELCLDYRNSPLWYRAIKERHTRGVTIEILFTGKVNPDCGFHYLEKAASEGLVYLFYTSSSPKRDFTVTDRRAVWLEYLLGDEARGMYTFGPSELAGNLREEFGQELEGAHVVPSEKAKHFFSLIRERAAPEKIINYLTG